ncbi:MAG: SH3 domain-containing protein [Magnetovibrionaceae bacterium]
MMKRSAQTRYLLSAPILALVLLLVPSLFGPGHFGPGFVTGPENSFFGGQAFAQQDSSGLPLPRFVSLRAEEVNLRTGPGIQYPVDWVYRKRGLPMEVIAEFKTWRKVRDWQGDQGWVHQSMLTGTRGFIVVGSEPASLLAKADPGSAPVARLEPGVVGRVVTCPAPGDWCKASAQGLEGWIRRSAVWGLFSTEILE